MLADPVVEPDDLETRLVADVSGLVSPPTVCMKLFELVQSGRASAGAIGDVVALDPNLSARLLRIVNSSFYGLPSGVDSVARAVTVLGLSDLNNLVLAISAVRSFSTVGRELVSTDDFWRHSIFTALVARGIARRRGLREADQMFVAGLLHDVGITVIYTQLDGVEALRSASAGGEAVLGAAEVEHLGFNHASVSARLLESWQLPGGLVSAIRHHHDPPSAGTWSTEATVLRLADDLANATPEGHLLGEPVALEAALDDPQEAEEVLDAARAELAEVTRLLMPSR